MTTLNNAFKWQLTLEDMGYDSGSESLSVATPLCREPWPFHVLTQENFSFGPATPRAHPSPGYLQTVCHQLTYKEDNESPPDHSPGDDILAHWLPSIGEEEDDDIGEHFLTVSLDDDVWMEEPVPERHLCIHENSQHYLCPYLCPYSLNPLYLTQEEAPQYIDLSDIFKFPDVVSASDDDIPNLEDIHGL